MRIDARPSKQGAARPVDGRLRQGGLFAPPALGESGHLRSKLLKAIADQGSTAVGAQAL